MFTHILQSLFDHHSKWHFVDSLLGTFVLNCLYAKPGREHELIAFKRYMVWLYNTFQCIQFICYCVLYNMLEPLSTSIDRPWFVSCYMCYLCLITFARCTYNRLHMLTASPIITLILSPMYIKIYVFVWT